MNKGKSTASFASERPEEYASLDPLAVIALILGIASIGAVVFSSLFLGAGILAVIFGVISLIRVVGSDGVLAGKGIATVAVALGLLFSSLQIGYAKSREAKIQQAGKEIALKWLELVQNGKLNEAHQLTKIYWNREVPGTDLEKHYGETVKSFEEQDMKEMMNTGQMAGQIGGTPFDERTDFFRTNLMATIIEQGKECDFEFVRALTTFRDKQTDYVVLQFNLKYEKDGQPVKELFDITLKRDFYGGPYGTHWAIDMINQERTKIDRTREAKSRE